MSLHHGPPDTATLTVRGAAGTAARMDPARQYDALGPTVDDWVIRPSGPGAPVSVFVFGVPAAWPGRDASYSLVVMRLRLHVSRQCQALGMPTLLGWDVLVLCPVPVDQDEQVRALVRELMHLAVDGAVPVDPRNAAEARMWATSVRALAAARAAQGAVA